MKKHSNEEKSDPQNFRTFKGLTRFRSDNKVGFFSRAHKYLEAGLECLWELFRNARLYKVSAAIVSGKEKHSGQPVKALYVGNFNNFAFVFGRICSEFGVIEEHRNINPLGIRSWVKRYKGTVDLVVADVELLLCKTLPWMEFIQIPQWIRQKFDVPDSWEAVWNSFRKSAQKELRRVLKYGFTHRTTNSEEDFKTFYHRMYVPYIKERYGDEAIIVPETKFLRKCRRGQLMQLIRGGKVIYGALINNIGPLSIEWVGVPDNLEPEMLKGASAALDYFIILYAYEYGNQTIDFGPSRPLLNDGLFQYKRKWGTYLQDSRVPRGDILLKPLNFTIPIISFFVNNHFITRDGKRLVGKILFNEHRLNVNDLEHIKKCYFIESLDHLKIFALSGIEDDAREFAKVESHKLRLFDLTNRLHPEEDFCRL